MRILEMCYIADRWNLMGNLSVKKCILAANGWSDKVVCYNEEKTESKTTDREHCHEVTDESNLPRRGRSDYPLPKDDGAYIMGYLQVMLLKNFDEAENITRREFLSMLLCTAIYTGCSYLFCWFDRSLLATGAFFCSFCSVTGACTSLIKSNETLILTN